MEEVLAKVNYKNGYSEVFRQARNFTKYLGGIERDEDGKIVKAKATFIRFFGKVNNTGGASEGARETTATGPPVKLIFMCFFVLWYVCFFSIVHCYEMKNPVLF